MGKFPRPRRPTWKIKQKKKYPLGYSEEELVEEIKRTGGLSEEKASLGIVELQRRMAKKTNQWSLGVAILALVASVVAIVLSYQALHTSSAWRSEQIEILKKMECLLDDSRPGRLPC